MNSIDCKNCGGNMEVVRKSRYNQGFGFLLLILGFISLVFGMPPGIIMIGIGFYMCGAKENVWFCGECKTAISRVEV